MRLRLASWLVLTAATPAVFFANATAQQAKVARGAESSAALAMQARRLIQSGDAKGALSLLEHANPRTSNTSEFHTLKGICFAMTEKPIESTAEFDRAIALRPNYGPTYLSAGLAAASFNNLDRAEQMLSTALRLDPGLPGLRYNYALVLARAGKYADSESEVDLELARKGPPAKNTEKLWTLKARDAYRQKKWQDTIDSYKKVLEFHPGWAEAYSGIGEALYSLNRSKESQTALEKALALDPRNGTAHKTLGKLYQDEGKLDDAITQFEATLRLMPNDQESIYRLLRIYSRKGNRADAARLQKQLQEMDSADAKQSIDESKATVFNNTGIALEKKGDIAGALKDYSAAAQIDVSNIVFQRNAALLLCKMGRTQEAIRRLRDILSLDPDDAETLQILAVANELASGHAEKKQGLPAPQLSR